MLSSGAGPAPAAAMEQFHALGGREPPAHQWKFKNERPGSLLSSGYFPSDKGQVCIFRAIFDTVLNLGKVVLLTQPLWPYCLSSPTSSRCTLRSCKTGGKEQGEHHPLPDQWDDAGPKFPGARAMQVPVPWLGSSQRVSPKVPRLGNGAELVPWPVGASGRASPLQQATARFLSASLEPGCSARGSHWCWMFIPMGSAEQCR